MPDVKMPDGTIIRNVPEGATRSQLMERYGKAKKDTRPTSFLQGVKEGVLTPFNNAARLLETGLDKIGVADSINKLGESIGMASSVGEAERTQQRNAARSPTRGSGAGRFVGEVVGTIPTAVVSKNPFVQGAMATGLLTDKREPDQIAAEMAVGGVLGKVGDVALRGVAGKIARKKAAKAVPSIADLKKQAGALYGAAETRGVIANQRQTKALAAKFRQIASQEGLRSPTGRISTAYPKAKEALDLTRDYARGTMTPKQMQTVRKVLGDAAGSSDNSERRIARSMLETFDDWTAPLSPELAKARSISRRYINAQKLEQARELAGSKAGQFSGSGFENALRTEYRGLDRRIVKGQERGFTPELVEAINNVSRGTKGGNLARNVGKLAPTGVVSAGLGTGIPFAIGNSMGGPVTGGLLAGASNVAGITGRKVATDIGLRNATLAELIARQGGPLPQVQQAITPEMQALLTSLLSASAQSASREDAKQKR